MSERILRKRLHDKSEQLERRTNLRSRKLNVILKKREEDRSIEDVKLLEENQELVTELSLKIQKSELIKLRLQEIEDDLQTVASKVEMLANLMENSKYVVFYTGAGISTSAEIPDYRGPNGVWTQLKLTGKLEGKTKDIALACPTLTHMAIKAFYDRGLVKHIVSQNCDGLHLRSGLPSHALSEIHGNMFIEMCLNCQHQFVRDFDVTEHTSFRRHRTGRKCGRCFAKRKTNYKDILLGEEEKNPKVDHEEIDLIDSIIHFGEKSRQDQPYNWHSASQAVEKCDLIVCLGSSLKVLREYKCLWPNRQRKVPLVIINLQWTSKDKMARLKINAKCDQVMQLLADRLEIKIPTYSIEHDRLKAIHEPLNESELHTCNRHRLFQTIANLSNEIDSNCSAGWFGKGIKPKK